MPKFKVTREITWVEYYESVEADTPEEAKQKVRDGEFFDYEELLEAKAPVVESEVSHEIV